MSGMPQPPGPNTPCLCPHHPSPAVVLRTCFSGPRCTVWQREAQLYSSECPRHTCADVCVPSHVRWACVRLLGVGAVEAPGLHVPAGQHMAGHGDTCVCVYTRPELAPAACVASFLRRSCRLGKEETGWAGLSRVPQRGGRGKVGGRGQARVPGRGRGWGVACATCFLSCRWRWLWTEGWPPSGRRCLEKWGFWRLSQLPPEFIRILYHFFLQAVTQLPCPRASGETPSSALGA